MRGGEALCSAAGTILPGCAISLEVQGELVTRGTREEEEAGSPITLISTCLPILALASTPLICSQATVWARLLARLTVLQYRGGANSSTRHKTQAQNTG